MNHRCNIMPGQHDSYYMVESSAFAVVCTDLEEFQLDEHALAADAAATPQRVHVLRLLEESSAAARLRLTVIT